MSAALVVMVAIVAVIVILIDVAFVRWLRSGSPLDDVQEPSPMSSIRYVEERRCASHGGVIQEDFPVEVSATVDLLGGRALPVRLLICQSCASAAAYGR